jgi:DNA-binding transcriptional regulator LsrR (DeoR family)
LQNPTLVLYLLGLARVKFARAAMSPSGPLADREIMRLVAELYYERDLRQPEVAAVTGFSVSKVSRLLSAAREQGIVHISVEPPPEERPAVAEELEQRFGLLVRITPGQQRDAASASRLAGLGAADHAVPWIPETGTIGIASGYTVAALVSALPRLHLPDLLIVPIVGGWDTENPFLDGNEAARRMAERLGAQSRTLHAPAIVDTPEMKDALLREPTVAATASTWGDLDVVLLGIGGQPRSYPGYRTVVDRLGEASRRELQELAVTGDLAGHFFRDDGSFVDAWSSRTLAISVEELRAAKRVIAVAAGAAKAAPILGALRTGIVDMLVTDRSTAEAVLRLAGRPR